MSCISSIGSAPLCSYILGNSVVYVSLTDNLNLTDLYKGVYDITWSETIPFTELFYTYGTSNITLEQSLAFEQGFGTVYEILQTDDMSMSDEYKAAYAFGIIDTLSLTDDFSILRLVHSAIQQTLLFADAFNGIIPGLEQVDQQLLLTELYTFGKIYRIELCHNLSFSEIYGWVTELSLTQSLNMTFSLQEVQTLLHTLTLLEEWGDNFADVCGLEGFPKDRSTRDILTLSQVMSCNMTYNVSIVDNLNLKNTWAWR